MPRRKKGSVPNLRLHKPSRQAVVTPSGEDSYCGPWGTKIALAQYDRHVSEWLARGRRPLVHTDETSSLTVVELVVAYKRFAKGYYRKNGKVTNEVTAIHSASMIVKRLYGREPASEFGPLKLKAVQQARSPADNVPCGNVKWSGCADIAASLRSPLVPGPPSLSPRPDPKSR